MGRKEDALREAHHAVELLPISRDVIEGAVVQAFQALVLARTGETDKAISDVERLLTTPFAVDYADEAITLSAAQDFPHWLAMGLQRRGEALIELEQGKEGIAQIQQGLVACQSTGAQIARSRYLAMLAEAYGNAGQATEGLALLAEALTVAQSTGERFYEAEFYRLKGELVLKANIQYPKSTGDTLRRPDSSRGRRCSNPHVEAEECFRQAIASARCQGAKSLELRAVLSLSRLWQSQGQKEEARQLLAEIYGWFTEGFDTADLQEAKALLAELA